VSDIGPQFTSDEFKTFLNRNGVKQTLVAPYSPKSNGAAEKSVQVVKAVLLKQLAEVDPVKTVRTVQQKLDDFLIMYRATPSTVTGVTPTELMVGRKVRTRLSLLRPEDKIQVRPMEYNIRIFGDGD
jgi:transposase InsO family protein